MKTLTKRPILLGVIVGVLLLVLCICVPIPMYDGIVHYDHGLVHFQLEGKIALSYYFGIGLDKVIADGAMPSGFELKPIGYALLGLIHIGLPVLIAIRFKMSNARKKIEKPADE